MKSERANAGGPARRRSGTYILREADVRCGGDRLGPSAAASSARCSSAYSISTRALSVMLLRLATRRHSDQLLMGTTEAPRKERRIPRQSRSRAVYSRVWIEEGSGWWPVAT